MGGGHGWVSIFMIAMKKSGRDYKIMKTTVSTYLALSRLHFLPFRLVLDHLFDLGYFLVTPAFQLCKTCQKLRSYILPLPLPILA